MRGRRQSREIVYMLYANACTNPLFSRLQQDLRNNETVRSFTQHSTKFKEKMKMFCKANFKEWNIRSLVDYKLGELSTAEDPSAGRNSTTFHIRLTISHKKTKSLAALNKYWTDENACVQPFWKRSVRQRANLLIKVQDQPGHVESGASVHSLAFVVWFGWLNQNELP